MATSGFVSRGRPALLALAALFAIIAGFGSALFAGTRDASAVAVAPFITISQGACGQGGWTFHVIAQGLGDGNGGTLTVTYTYPPDNTQHQVQQPEDQDNDAVADWHVTIPFNGHASILITGLTNGSISWDGTHGSENKLASSTACPQELPGAIRVYKVVTNVASDPTSFNADVDGGSSFSFSELAPSSNQAASAGSHTVTEAPNALYTTLGWASQVNEKCPESPTNIGAAANVSVTSGHTTIICFYNSKNAIQIGRLVTICKVVDNNGDAIDDGGLFTFDVAYSNGGTQVSITAHESDGPNGVCKTIQVPLDFKVTVTERPDVRPNGWNDEANYPKYTVDNGALTVGNVASLNYQGKNATFHNKNQRGVGHVRVIKRTTLNGAPMPAEDGGWHITVSSANCGYFSTQDTIQGQPYGYVSFTNLPVCNDYVVKEDPLSKPGFTPVLPAVHTNVVVSKNDTQEIDFENNMTFILPCLFGCTPPTTQTPTPTPTTPTQPPSTTTPTTTTVPPTQVPPTSTSISVVLGEKTPLPPSTGSGVAMPENGQDFSYVLAAIGLGILAAGFVTLGVAARRK